MRVPNMTVPGERATRARASNSASGEVARAYDRIAFLYDLYDAPMSALGGRRRRRRLLSRAAGRVLEVGIGTGANLDLYPPGIQLTGIDISAKMLARARRRAARLGSHARLQQADVEQLPFADATFDAVVATWVFCAVADPLRGLREVRRVVRPDGQVLLLEHVRPANPLAACLALFLSPVIRRLIGAEADRRTEDTVARSGLRIVEAHGEAIWREIVAVR